MDERRLTLSVRLPHRPVMVNGDAVRLEQIVSNLLENASKYTEPGGHVELKVGQRAGEAMLSVRDDGIGLAPESQELIFELFAQVDGSLARTSGGLGIGLTLVRRLLDLHGGRIEVRSAGLGQGAEFIVRLPLERAMPASDTAAATGARSAVPTAASHRVLIVDDNADAADTMGLLVQHWGHEVATANDGLTALEVARQFVPDLALVDIGLPGMDGYEVARRMRDLNPEIVLVALTGYGRAADRDAARAAGFDRHMVKPADLDELQRLMATKAGHRRRSDEP
jgi:CheY-like chemotaxis protein